MEYFVQRLLFKCVMGNAGFPSTMLCFSAQPPLVFLCVVPVRRHRSFVKLDLVTVVALPSETVSAESKTRTAYFLFPLGNYGIAMVQLTLSLWGLWSMRC